MEYSISIKFHILWFCSFYLILSNFFMKIFICFLLIYTNKINFFILNETLIISSIVTNQQFIFY